MSNAIRRHLEKAKALIRDPEQWGKGQDRVCSCALDALRIDVDMTDADEAVRVCVDALEAALPSTFEPDPNDWNSPVAQFNDAAATDHSDVMALYDRAIAAA